jgi:hypothetical protein
MRFGGVLSVAPWGLRGSTASQLLIAVQRSLSRDQLRGVAFSLTRG